MRGRWVGLVSVFLFFLSCVLGGLIAQEAPAPPATSAAEPPPPLPVPVPDQAPAQDPGIFTRIDPCVVTIGHERALGSGFILSEDGYILTNGHVVMDDTDNEDPKAVSKRITVTLSDERKFQARVLGHNLDPDVALIKIDVGAERLTPVEIGDSRAVRVGQRCFAVGSPQGLRRTLTSGVLSNIERTDLGTFTTVLQTDAAINPGNSGGPLFDEQGRVLGINTYAVRGNNLGFTVPIHVAMVLQEHYRRYGHFRRAALPFFFSQETHDQLAAALGLPERGVLLDFVEEGSGAWAAGLRSGDVVVRVDGKPCPARTRTDLLGFRWDFTTREIGSRVALGLLRFEEGSWKPRAVEADLVEDEPAPAMGNQRGEIPELLYQPLGLGVRRIVPLARYVYDLATDRGVLVSTIGDGSAAGRAGLLENDVLTGIDGVACENADSFRLRLEEALRARSPSIRLEVLRGLQTRFVTALAPFYPLRDKRVVICSTREATALDELMRRELLAYGAEVVVAPGGNPAPGEACDALILQGDLASLRSVSGLRAAVEAQAAAGKVVAALGDAPVYVAECAPSLREKKATCLPDQAEALRAAGANYTGKDVETDGKWVTSIAEDKQILRRFLEALVGALE